MFEWPFLPGIKVPDTQSLRGMWPNEALVFQLKILASSMSLQSDDQPQNLQEINKKGVNEISFSFHWCTSVKPILVFINTSNTTHP